MSRGVEAALDELRPGLSGITVDTNLFRPARFIESATRNLALAVLGGLLLAAVLLGAFLLDWRVALISLVTVPLSLLAATFVLYLRGATFNTMILAGLLIALAVVVDDAVVDIDNIGRRLRRQRQAEGREAGPPAGEAATATTILRASLEVRGPLLYATLIIAVSAVPLVFLGGLTGSFARPLVASYLLAVLASTVVALVVTPALAMLLLPRGPLERRPSPLARWLDRGHAAALTRLVARPRLALGAVAVLAVAGLAMLPFVGGRSMLPALQDRDLLIHWEGAPGMSQPEMSRITALAARELRSVPGVRDVGAHSGRAVGSDQIVNVNSAELWVSVDPRPTTPHGGRHRPGRRRLPRPPPQPDDLSRGPDAAGPDGHERPWWCASSARTCRCSAARRRRCGGHRGGRRCRRPRVDLAAQEPTLEIEVDLAAAQEQGMGDVRRAEALQLSGVTVGNLFEDQKVFDVQVWSTPATRDSLSKVEDLLIDKPGGGKVRLGDVATVRVVPAPSVIRHADVSRYLDVTAGVRGRSLGAVTQDVQQRLRGIQFPLEHHAVVLGQSAERGGTGSGS